MQALTMPAPTVWTWGSYPFPPQVGAAGPDSKGPCLRSLGGSLCERGQLGEVGEGKMRCPLVSEAQKEGRSA